MSNNTVKFTINIDGNAVKNISALQQETDKLNITAEKTESLFNRIGRACINLNQIYTTLAGSIGGIVNKLNNYEQLTTAQVEAETKLAQYSLCPIKPPPCVFSIVIFAETVTLFIKFVLGLTAKPTTPAQCI